MSAPLVECVPNFCEGRDPGKIATILDAVRSVPGAEVLHVDSGASAHRTVVTLLGSPGAMEEAAFRAIRTAVEVIDMSTHAGVHPRQGAVDVCPFVPYRDITMAECSDLAARLGERVGRELDVPVYLYGEAASTPERRSLARIRRGEYEALGSKLEDPRWAPDFGPRELRPRSGALTIGSRNLLIAFNVNLETDSVEIARDIAAQVRDTGRRVRRGGHILRYRPARGEWPCAHDDVVTGSLEELRDHYREIHELDLDAELAIHDLAGGNFEGVAVRRRGRFRECRALGWRIPELRRAQVTMNLTDYRVTPPHVVLEECQRLAIERGTRVTGSELVGMIPLPALRQAGERGLRSKGGAGDGSSLQDILEAGVAYLGLRDVKQFEIEREVLDGPR